MKKVPNAHPVTIAARLHINGRCAIGPMAPMASVPRLASPANQIGHKCHTLPWRSDKGT